jgi:hypothetical protein
MAKSMTLTLTQIALSISYEKLQMNNPFKYLNKSNLQYSGSSGCDIQVPRSPERYK